MKFCAALLSVLSFMSLMLTGCVQTPPVSSANPSATVPPLTEPPVIASPAPTVAQTATSVPQEVPSESETEAPSESQELPDTEGYASELLTASGTYVGLADNNFFEVKTSAAKAGFMEFMITDAIRATFVRLALKQGESVTIDYIPNEAGQNAVVGIRLGS